MCWTSSDAWFSKRCRFDGSVSRVTAPFVGLLSFSRISIQVVESVVFDLHDLQDDIVDQQQDYFLLSFHSLDGQA